MSAQKLPADEIKESFDKQLVRIRKALEDRTVTKVVEATGLHENTVRNIKNGRGERPSLTTIEKLGKYLFDKTEG